MTITETINALLQTPEYDYSPQDINTGLCEEFAWDICGSGLGAHSLWGPGHCFVLHGGKFYDSECPEGVSDPRDLPIYHRGQPSSKEWADYGWETVDGKLTHPDI